MKDAHTNHAVKVKLSTMTTLNKLQLFNIINTTLNGQQYICNF